MTWRISWDGGFGGGMMVDGLVADEREFRDRGWLWEVRTVVKRTFKCM